MSNIVAKCPRCEYTCEFRHLHDAAHGIEGTHMTGSERFECSNCRHNIFAGYPGSEQFTFILDGRK